eukprot:8415058-Pyramimonas_sp.AAC.1
MGLLLRLVARVAWEIWRGLQANASAAGDLRRPAGEDVDSVRGAVYFGGLISCDGQARHELSPKLGEGLSVPKQLQNILAHAATG